MNAIIKEGFQNSMSYKTYRELMKKLVAEKGTTGIEKTEALINYTKLNDSRMNRWDKTLKISDEDKVQIFSIS